MGFKIHKTRPSGIFEQFFFFRQSLLDTGRARTRTQPQAAPESALDATHELALTETVDLLPAFTRAAHDAEGPLRGALYSRHKQRALALTA